MDIDYVYVKNFRQYQDVKIKFARSPSKNCTIIIGSNGAGKTNLLNAITWCFFGKELHVDSKYKGLPILNTTTLDESREGILELRVEIQLIQSNGKKILVIRTVHFKKGKEGNPIEVTDPHAFSVMRETERDWVGPIYGDDAQYLIDNLIPPSIEEYFFFDGERMDDYFKESTGEDIRRAVFKISQLELFETLINHLTTRRSSFLREARGLGSEAEEIREMIELQTRSLESDKEVLAELEAKRIKAEHNEKVFSEKLKKSSLEHIQSLEERRVELESDITRIQREIEDIENDRLKQVHRSMPMIFCHDALIKTKNSIDGRREAGLIPPPIASIFVKNLLKKGICICRSDISGKDEYSLKRRKNVKAFLETSKLSGISNELVEMNVHIAEMIESMAGFPQEIVTIGKRLKVLQESKTQKNKTIQKISHEIDQSNVENIKQWEKERQKYGQEKNQLQIQVGLKKRDIERRNNIIRAYNIKLNQELKKQKKHKALLQVLAFCDEGMKCAQNIKGEIMNKVREEIEKRTSQQFLDLIWKKKTFEGVKIRSDYTISVPHVSGREALGTLSAGERQVCALSFMAALNGVSGFEVPIIIDTPLARISREPRKNIAKNLPNYLEGTQVTLLVTEEEYTPEVEKALFENVGKTYVINFVEKEIGSLAEVNLAK